MANVITNVELDMIYKQGLGESYYGGLRAVWLAGYQTGTGVTLTSDVSATGISQTPIDATPPILTP